MAKLEVLTVPSPCQASWEAMRGNDRVRHCLQCHLDVYDLSSMSRDEAERFVEEYEGEKCMRFLQRPDGTVITQDCEPLRAEPRACVPRPAESGAPLPSRSVSRAMAADDASSKAKPSAVPPSPPQQPLPRMGIVAMPAAPSATPEPIDARLEKGTLLAELARAVRAHLAPEAAERSVKAIEERLDVPADWRSGRCPHEGCPLWLSPRPMKRPPGLDDLQPLLDDVAPAVKASFDAERAKTLLRELSRLPFSSGHGACPHCRKRTGLHLPPSGVLPVPPPKP